MPSWNVHIAHVERLLDDKTARLDAVRDHDAFVLGNLVPDIYVGYMVPDVSHKIPYKDTHYANPDFVPAPDASLFYCRYVKDRDATDVTLGAWCHLLCDHYYNLRTTEYIDSIGVAPGEQTRIRKQGDFDLFGRTLRIRRVPVSTPVLLEQCAAFPQYPVDAPDVEASLAAAASIVQKNRERHVEGVPEYSLLTPEFFSRTYAEVHAVLCDALHAHVRGEDPTRWGNPAALQGKPCATQEDSSEVRGGSREAQGGSVVGK